MDNAVKPFQIIRHAGELNTATLPDGKTIVRRCGSFWVGAEYNRFIPVINDEVHFIYEIPDKLAKQFPGPVHRCTCGSMAVITGPSGYSWGQTDTVLYFCCHAQMTTGEHLGMSRWV